MRPYVAFQVPLSVGFSRQEYWSGLPFPSPGDLPDPEIEPWSPPLQADSSPSEPTGKLNLKAFAFAKETISKVERQPSEWEKIIANETTDKGLISKIYKQLI